MKKILNDLILPEEKWHPCGLLWNRFIVTYDGKLTICCIDFEAKMIYGQINKNSLKTCWNNALMRKFRKIHKDNNFKLLPMCLQCDAIKNNLEKEKELLEYFKK